MTENYTALYEEHKKLGASFTDFGGWQMPLKYSSELAEHHAVRNAAGLFDLSHMGEVWVTGPDAGAFLDYALVGKLSAIALIMPAAFHYLSGPRERIRSLTSSRPRSGGAP